MAKKMSLSPQAFAITQSHLIAKEQESEVTENQLLLSSSPPTILARAGLAILNLNVSSLRTGFGGRTVVELALDTAVTSTSTDIPEHGIRTGDIVRLSEQPKGSAKKKDVESLKSKGVEGVVTRIGERAVWVAIGKQGTDTDDEEVPDGKLWLVKLANDVTYKRINQTLTKLLKMPESNYTSLVRVLLGLSSPGRPDVARLGDIMFINPTINDSQKTAIKHALSVPELSLIHGPPGTGKTATVIELILQLLLANPDLRILVCGPSNISVDNIVERLSLLPSSLPTSSSEPIPNQYARCKKPAFTRLGHPARLLPNVLNHSLEVQTRTSDSAAIVKDVLSEMEVKQSSIRKTRSGRERRQIYTDLKDLRKEYRTREAKCASEVIRSSQVVCCTLHGAGSRQLFQQRFDVVIIDEASQALEAQCWIPLLSVIGVSKLILAGDHLQLPPTIKSNNEKIDKKTKAKNKAELETELKKLSISEDDLQTAHKTTLEDTMFSRLLDTHGPEIKTLLTIQYRMHELISRFPSQELYDSKLVPAPSVATHLLSDLPNITPTDDTHSPLIFIDTQGGNFPELDTSTSSSDDPKHSLLYTDSKSNPSEPPLILSHLTSLIESSRLPESSIAIITPYASQLSLLSALIRPLYPQIELGTVDGFQGREKEVVILSLVRSNEKGEVGFLKDVRRLNVAMTRARRCLVVVGDSETVSRGGGFLKRWIEYLEQWADVRYPEVGG